MTPTNTVAFSIRVTPEEKAKIERLAAQRGTSAKAALLAVVEEALGPAAEVGRGEPEAEVFAPPGSLLEKIRPILNDGHRVALPADLSTNPKYMEGFGRD